MPLQRLFHLRMCFCCMDLLERGRQPLLLRSSCKKWNGDRKFLLVLLQTLLLITLLSGLFLTSRIKFWQLLYYLHKQQCLFTMRFKMKFEMVRDTEALLHHPIYRQQYLLWPIYWHLYFTLTTCILSCLFIMVFTLSKSNTIAERCDISVAFSMWFTSPNTSI